MMLTLILQLFVNPTTQEDAAIEGVTYISELLVRYAVMEEVFIKKRERYVAIRRLW
jgi:hypothetical protein